MDGVAQGIAAENPSAELHAEQPFTRRLARLVEDQAKRSGQDPTLSATTGVFARGSQIVEVWKSTPDAPARALFELVTHPALLGPIAELLGGPMGPQNGAERARINMYGLSSISNCKCAAIFRALREA